MKILIIGGAGFIGCNIAARSIRRGDEVTIIDDLSRQGSETNLRWLKTVGSFEFHRLDIRDYRPLADFFSGRGEFALVLHLAAQVAVTVSVEDPRRDFETNALGTFNLLEAIRKAGRNPVCIFSSTNKVYGNLIDLDVSEEEMRYDFTGGLQGVSEEQVLDFHSPYGCSKGCADQYVRDYSRIYGLRTVVLRQSCIYGPRQFGVEDQGWVAWFMIAVVLGLPITIYGNGKQVRDLLYIDDLLDCFDLAYRKIESARGRIYNVGGGADNRLSLLEFLELLSELSGKEVKPAFAPQRPGDQPIYVSDNGKAERELGWKVRTDLREGLEKLYGWVVENKQTIQQVLWTGEKVPIERSLENGQIRRTGK